MSKKWISENTAKMGIMLTFAVMLLVCILFAWTAPIFSASALDNQVEEIEYEVQLPEYDVDLMLRQIEILETQIGTLQTQIDSLALQNEQLLETLDAVEGSFTLEYVGNFYATAYCAEEYPHICGGNGRTASGTIPTAGVTIAADWSVLPAGTWVYIDGVGVRRVEDKGSAIKGNKIDVCFATHNEALRWSSSNHDIWILEWNEEDS